MKQIAFFAVFIILFLLVPQITLAVPAPKSKQNIPNSPANPCGSGTSLATGLVSTPTLTGNFNTTGACIVDPKATFVPYKIPSYEDLKSMYYTQAKATNPTFTKHPQIDGDKDEQSIDLRGLKDHLYFINGNLTKNGTFPQDADQRAGVVFVEGNFTINSDIGYPGGLVFIIKGDVIIASSVNTINAVIISEGIIYTAGVCSHSVSVPASQLTINGSLISLNGDNKIEFCRTLGAGNNTTPAELINQQAKYLVILRDLFADTWQKWSEI